MGNDLLKMALEYAGRGWPVFPVWPAKAGQCTCGKPDCERPAKHPLGKLARNGRNSATTDPETIKKWWGRYPKANIGIATGPESGLVVVDIDPRNGGDVKRLPGNLPQTPTVFTGGGGEHYYLRHPGNGEIKSRDGMAGLVGIDQKADGGYILAPPSSHISGALYVWKVNPDTPLAPPPEWLMELLLKDGTPPRQPERQGGEPIPKGRRNSTLTSLAGTMRRRGMSGEAIEAALLAENARCDPPLQEEEVRAIARSVGRYAVAAPGQKAPAKVGPSIRLVTGAELEAIEFRDPQYVIEGILPEGLAVLAGRPKKGKTWWGLNVSAAKATGGYALGKPDLRLEQGKVLYLALEDKLRRAKKRLKAILGEAPFPEELILAETWPRLDKGGLEALQEFLKEHADCKLLVVDSYAKIKPPRPKHLDPYEFDMTVAGALQTLAQEHQICLLLIYHTRKAEAVDPLDEVIGSTGLTGAADAVLVLRRGRGQADGNLFVSGRDLEDQEFALKLHPGEGLWELMGTAAEYAMSQERKHILSILEEEGPKTPAQLKGLIGDKSITSIRMTLMRMKRAAEVRVNEKGEYFPNK